MLIIPPILYRSRPKKPSVGPVLLSAVFDTLSFALTLTFDRPVDAAGLVGATVLLDDAQYFQWEMDMTDDATALGPAVLRLYPANILGDSTGDVDTLTVSLGNGIVDSAGNAWGGVSGFAVEVQS